MKRRAEHEPAFVLHAYPYKETSLIVEAFSRRFGRIGLLARGARRPRSAMRGVLLAFHPLRMTWSASAELGTLMSAEWGGSRTSLSGIGLMCGFYLNELLLRLLPRDDPHEALFDAYSAALARLGADEAQAAVLRGFERRMLAELGYAPVLDRDAVGVRAHLEGGARHLSVGVGAEELEHLPLELRLLVGDVRDDIAEDVERRHTRIPGTGNGLHRRQK